MKYTVNIIGAGVAGLATAIRLAVQGHQVTVFEQSDRPGGKLDNLQWNGYRWDSGPSLFTLPDLVDELYVLAGEEMKKYLRYQKLELIYLQIFQLIIFQHPL